MLECDGCRRLLLESGGYELLPSLERLAGAGLLTANTGASRRSQYSVLSKRLGIVMDNVDEQVGDS